MTRDRDLVAGGIEPGRPASPTWLLVFAKELKDLWLGGKALYLIIAYSILLSLLSYVLASNYELSLIPPREMVFITVGIAIAVGLFIGLIIGADSISGERERGTLEALLLTPASRRQIVVGKFLAAISAWPVALAIAYPYIAVLSQGEIDAPAQAMLWGGVMGSLLVPAFAGLGMLVSGRSASIKTSMFVSLTVYVVFLVPTQLPGSAQTGFMGDLLQAVNPLESANIVLEKLLVNNRAVEELRLWFLAPAIFALLVTGALFGYAAPRLRLEAGRAIRFPFSRTVTGLAVGGLAVWLAASPAVALQDRGSRDAPTQAHPHRVFPEGTVQISIDREYATLRTGDRIDFATRISWSGPKGSPPMTVALNLVNLDGEGAPVDPEDWSPQRAQYIERLEPGGVAELSWTIRTILEGDYVAYMVVIPYPEGPDASSRPAASSAIHLTVAPFRRLNAGGVLPVAVSVPAVLILVSVLLSRLRRRSIDTGVGK